MIRTPKTEVDENVQAGTRGGKSGESMGKIRKHREENGRKRNKITAKLPYLWVTLQLPPLRKWILPLIKTQNISK